MSRKRLIGSIVLLFFVLHGPVMVQFFFGDEWERRDDALLEDPASTSEGKSSLDEEKIEDGGDQGVSWDDAQEDPLEEEDLEDVSHIDIDDSIWGLDKEVMKQLESYAEYLQQEQFKNSQFFNKPWGSQNTIDPRDPFSIFDALLGGDSFGDFSQSVDSMEKDW